MSRTILTVRCSEPMEDEIGARLAVSGCLGWVTRPDGAFVVLEADFGPTDVDVAAALCRETSAMQGVNASLATDVPDRDWLQVVAAGYRPIEVGRLWIDPTPAGAGEPPPGRIPIRVRPERAFGTGSHESTRLLLEALDRHSPDGQTVLDVGTGSGILALASLALGARRAVGVEVDPEAVMCARANVGSSGLALVAGRIASLREGVSFDLVLANINGPVLLDLMPDLLRRTAPAGCLRLAGLLTVEAPAIRDRVGELGWRVVGEAVRGEWSALEVRRS